MSESKEAGMRTPEHMSETPYLNEKPSGDVVDGAQPEPFAPITGPRVPQGNVPVSGGVVILQSGSLPAAAELEAAKGEAAQFEGAQPLADASETPAQDTAQLPMPQQAQAPLHAQVHPETQAWTPPAQATAPKLDPVTKLSNMIKAQVASTVTTDSPVAEAGSAAEVPLITSVPVAPAFASKSGLTTTQPAAPASPALAARPPAPEGGTESSDRGAAPGATTATPTATLATPTTATPTSAAAVAAAAATFAMPVAPAPETMAGPGDEPERPTVPDLPAEQKGQGRPLSLFEPVEVLRGGMLPEDLPFANEVDAALARRPLRMERYLSLAVGCGILLFILWAAFASIDEVTHAEGQVISSQRTQAIQNLEGGILRNILVSEGQTVEKGDVLAQLDNEMAASSYRDAINKALDNTLAIIRLEAELKGEVPQFPENVEEWVREVVGPQNMMTALPQAHQAIKDQMSAYQARTQQKSAELLLLESQYQQRMHEVGELSARKRQLDESLALAVEQRDIAAGLLQKRSTSRVDYLNQQQRVVQLSGEVEALASTIPKAQSAAQETSQRMTFRRAEIDAAVTDELNKRRMDLASINETLSAGGDRVTRTELRSPVRGTVKRIAVTTLGGVVKPGESIMEIVPLDDTLLVEAKVRPSDVAFLRPGQRAMVKVSAYDFSIYGGLEGALEQISADTIEDKRGEFFYLVKVRTNKTAIQHQDKSLPIIPGMMATVDILIGKKTVLDYLLKPILKARDRALRER